MVETAHYTYDFGGGWLCLDFNNTLDQDKEGGDVEHLHTYADLVEWAAQSGMISPGKARLLTREAETHPSQAATTLADAIALRRLIYRVFSAVADGHEPESADSSALNAALGASVVWLRIVRAPSDNDNDDSAFEWGWADGGSRLDQILWPIVWSAAQLLVSERLHQVRECGSENCRWIFMDTSRNHSRRWCSMESCGNRAKQRRHYHRIKASDLDTN
ncbi:MAG: CGNR zinc finger domain-containing protein [Burkholderiales bacterium]|nr:CGNR zinc finger domain-containing protein [Anaerolineae bacterium]